MSNKSNNSPQVEKEIKEKQEPVENKEKKGEMITISKGILEQLLNDVQDLKTGKRRAQPKRVVEHIATIKVVDDKYPVIEITKTWVENKGKPDEVTMCQVRILKDIEKGETELRAYPYLDFLNNVVGYQVKILKQEAKVDEKFYGMIRKTNPDPIKMGDTGKNFTSGETENIVKTAQYVSEVEFTEGTPLEGRKITISNNFLNI